MQPRGGRKDVIGRLHREAKRDAFAYFADASLSALEDAASYEKNTLSAVPRSIQFLSSGVRKSR